MQAGLLRDRITLEEAVVTRDKYGAQNTEWASVWSGRAWVRFSSGSQVVLNGETQNTITRKITIRTRFAVNHRMRIVYGQDHYRILSIDDSALDRSKTMTVELINE